MIQDFSSLWVEKYRPRSLDELVLSDFNHNFFKNLKDTIPHLLFCSAPGQGKTSLAKIIVKDILKCQYLYINASDENGIDDIRNKVITFSQTRSIDGKIKVVILDEADNLTGDAQRVLRNVMEEYADHTRYILTANYLHRIIEAITSRSSVFDLTTDITRYGERLLWILKQEDIKIPNDLKLLQTFIKERYPDFRRAINDLQKFTVSKELVIQNIHSNNISSYIVKHLLEKTNIFELRQYIITNESELNSTYSKMLKELFEEFYINKNIHNNKLKFILLNISEYMYRDAQVLDKEINFFSCLLQIENILNS